MNERLKELMIQADYPAPELALRAHRLAELIVRDCLSNMEDCDGDLDFAIWKTKKHFGVEE